MISWVGPAYEHLYAVMMDGRTFRLDKTINVEDGTSFRHWTLVAQLPMVTGESLPAIPYTAGWPFEN